MTGLKMKEIMLRILALQLAFSLVSCAKEIKKRAGIAMEIQYTSDLGSLEALTAAIASGDLPDAIYHYLNNSTRPYIFKSLES